ncbi:MAG: dockerin, partial [Actinomycetota bacterium]|nr:dockerin [Actinomycetota bacterium]
EAGSSEYGGSKAAWVRQALRVELPTTFPRVKAFVWFNSLNDGDWPISTSVSARTAFAAGIASPYFTSNDFRTDDSTPIKPA